jgi:hypothetical protein
VAALQARAIMMVFASACDGIEVPGSVTR